MKQIILFVALFLGSLFCTTTAQANIPCFAGLSATAQNTTLPTSSATIIIKKDKGSWVKKAANWIVKKVKDMDQKSLLFIILAALIGTLGIHRVVAGSKPIIILWYILIALGISLVYTLLSIATGGLFGLFGWILYWILPLFDIIKMSSKGISHFEDNNDVFAGFK